MRSLVRKIFKLLATLLKLMNPILRDIKEIEFNQIHYDKESDNNYKIKEGNIPILLSAPHGCKHLRNGKWKEEDEYTSSIAIKLGDLTGAHVIYVRNKTAEDSNYLIDTRYKDEIKKLVDEKGIRFVADIHGLDKDRPSKDKPSKVIVGIIDEKDMKKCSCPGFKQIIEECFKGFEEGLFNVGGYNAASQGTVTYFAKHICNIEAAQFEINAKYRIIKRKPDSSKAVQGVEPDFKANGKDIMDMFNHLKEMMLNIKEKIETK